MQVQLHVQPKTSILAHTLTLSNYGAIRLGVDVVVGLGIEGIKDRLSRLRFVRKNDVGSMKKSAPVQDQSLQGTYLPSQFFLERALTAGKALPYRSWSVWGVDLRADVSREIRQGLERVLEWALLVPCIFRHCRGQILKRF